MKATMRMLGAGMMVVTVWATTQCLAQTDSANAAAADSAVVAPEAAPSKAAVEPEAAAPDTAPPAAEAEKSADPTPAAVAPAAQDGSAEKPAEEATDAADTAVVDSSAGSGEVEADAAVSGGAAGDSSDADETIAEVEGTAAQPTSTSPEGTVEAAAPVDPGAEEPPAAEPASKRTWQRGLSLGILIAAAVFVLGFSVADAFTE